MIIQVLKWFTLNTFLNYIIKKMYINFVNREKRVRNYISFIHSLLWIYKLFFINFTDLTLISISYYIYDIIYILIKYLKNDFIYIYHHIVCISLLFEFENINEYDLYYIYCIAEVSNFFLYIVYEMLKNNTLQTKLIKLKYVQVLWYMYFRVICFTYYIYSKRNSYSLLKSYNQLGGFSIYCIGLIWTINQIKLLI